MHFTLSSLLYLGCAAINAFCLHKCLEDAVTHPDWYCVLPGFMTAYCLAMCIIVTFI